MPRKRGAARRFHEAAPDNIGFTMGRSDSPPADLPRSDNPKPESAGTHMTRSDAGNISAGIQVLRRRASAGICCLIWLQLPLLVAIGIAAGTPWLVPSLVALVLAVVASAMWRFAPDSLEFRLTSGVALVGLVALV